MLRSVKPGASFSTRGPRPRRAAGFTLMETALATIIIGVGFVGLMMVVTNGTYAGRTATQDTTAINLANNIHEASLRTSFDQIFTLDKTFTTPVDGRLAPLANMGGWQQAVTVKYVDPNQITLAVTPAGPTVRVTVSVLRNGAEAHRASWLISAPPT
jgi:type II secretory pathway pseudopilin PulG